ncbi:MAG: type II toxin-antitoxin system HigA family antitoxin [Cyanophyceae cyanobacterium]
MLDLKPIRTEADYQLALSEIDRLFDAPLGTPECDHLDILATLVEAYEMKHDPIPLPTPDEALLFRLASRRSVVAAFIDRLKRQGMDEADYHTKSEMLTPTS